MSRIALIGNNSIKYVEYLIEIWNSGNCAVLINSATPYETLLEMMFEAKVEKCIVEDSIYRKWEFSKVCSIFFEIYKVDLQKNYLLCDDIYNSFIDNYSNSEAVIIYSSGTTGKSKGVILSHYAINTNADLIYEYMQITDNDTLYIVKSFTHSSTLTGELLVALKNKIKILIGPTVVPPRYILENIYNYNITILCLNPTLLNLLANEYKINTYNIKSLRKIYVSGSILNDKIYTKAKKIFQFLDIYNVYGLSEAGPRVTAQRKESYKVNSVGKPLTGIEIEIVDKDGKIVNCGERGIIHISTPCIYSGYTSGKVKNKSLYNEWLNTGDIGYFDNNKELYVVGRIDDVIIIDSHKIYPEEIEKIILTHNNIEECAIIKVQKNDKDYLCCIYVAEKEVVDLKKYLSNYLLPYEIPKKFVKINEIPKNNNGKTCRKICAEKIKGVLNEK